MNIHDIPLPLVLGENRRVHPTRVSINLAITPLSDASMSLPQGESLPARGYVELFTCMGSAGIFRVRSPQDAYGMVTTTAELEHAIVEVGDYLVKAKYDEMMAANTAMQTIFSHYGGSKWQLGSVSALGSGQIALQANYDRVLEAMLAILEQKPDCMMSFDFSTSPWTVNIVARGTTVTAEGRLARNINSAKVIYDDTELCTRAYYEKKATTDSISDVDLSDFPTFDASRNYNKNAYVIYSSKLYQLPSGHTKDVTWANTTKVLVDDIPTTVWQYVDADTIGTYGRIEREVRTGSSDTDAEALRTVNEYLNKHKHPRVSVDISAVELSHITGESFDSFDIGKLFRLCLADYNNLTVEKNVINLYFDDVYERPENITVTLAEEEDTALTFIHDVDAKGGSGGGGGGGKRQDDKWKEYRTIFEQDDYHFGLYAQRLNTAEEILQQAGLYIDSNGVLIFAEDNENMLGSKLSVQAGRITAVATRMSNAEDILSQAGLEIDADTGVLIYHTDNANMLGAKMAVQAGKIEMVVGTGQSGNYIKAASITLAINNAGSSAMINADKIYLLGDTIANTITADYIQTKIASLASLNVASLTSERGGISVYSVGTTTFTQGGVVCYVPHAISNVQITGPTNNVYTLQKKTFANDSWTDAGSFSRAVSSWSVGGGSGKVNVTANPQAQTKSVPVSIGGSNNITSNGTYTYKVYYENASGDDVETGASMRVTVNVSTSDRYNEGWNACRNAMIESQWYWTGYTGEVTTKYDAPTYGAQGRKVIYPYQSANHYRYTVPDAK